MDALTREPVDLRPRKRLKRGFALLLGLLVIAAIVFTVWFWPKMTTEQKAARGGAGLPVPVLVANVVRRDTPIHLDGLGTVQAFQTVTVKSMVDGPLISVAFKEGQQVKAGDVLARIDPRSYKAALDSATAKKAQDEALLANARIDLARYQKLVANAYTSAQQVDTAKAQVAQYQAIVEQDQAAIDNARTQLGYTTITAPIDGRTGIRQVDAGNIVRAGDASGLVVITQLQPISVVFTLPQQSLPAVAKAMQTGAPPVQAFSQAAGPGAELLDTGTLTVIDNQVDPATGTIKLKATFPNRDERLWPGGFVGVRLQVRVAKDAVIVPPAAVQRGPRGSFVYVVENGATVRRQAVTIGHEDEQAAIVLDGLKGGDQVVIDGASRLSDGSKVVPAMAEANGGGASSQQGAPGSRRRRGG